MSSYFRRPEMVNGRGFRCYNCGKTLTLKLDGNDYEIRFKCPRCKAKITVIMNEPVTWKKTKKEEDTVASATS